MKNTKKFKTIIILVYFAVSIISNRYLLCVIKIKSIILIIDYQCNGSRIRGNVFRQACNRKDVNYGHMFQLKNGSLTEITSFTSRFYARIQLPDNSQVLKVDTKTQKMQSKRSQFVLKKNRS